MYRRANVSLAVYTAKKKANNHVVFHNTQEDQYYVCTPDKQPEGTTLIWTPEDGYVNKPSSSTKKVKEKKTLMETGPHNPDFANTVLPTSKETKKEEVIEVEEKKETPGLVYAFDEAKEGKDITVTEEQRIPSEEEVKEAEDDYEKEEEKETILQDSPEITEMEEEEMEQEQSIESEDKQLLESVEKEVSEEIEEIDPDTIKKEVSLPKIVIRQTEPRGAVTVGTINVRETPRPEMAKEIEDLPSCMRIIKTGGAIHAYPNSDEEWADLMESTIKLVKKYYPELKDGEIKIDRIS